MPMIKITFLTAILLISNFVCAAEDPLTEKQAAENSTENPIDYKLTLSHYSTQHSNANDINMRVSKDNQTLWLAEYMENPSGFNQVRAGYERRDRFDYLRLVSSLQVASHGFLGGALTAEIGGAVYAIAGYGRTNLKPYNNINFDPNDAITLGLGWHAGNDLTISVYGVQDNRVINGQRITHLTVNKVMADDQKITFDLFQKSGTRDGQGQSIQALGASISYDLNRYFMRLAYDPKVNFTQEDMTRVSLGMHF